MGRLKPITIVGGGLAGLTLGIGLRQGGVPVVLWETGHYPRHRVCGEFVSGRGQDALRRLGVLEMFLSAGASLARSARFFLGRSCTPARAVQPPALCLSRFRMDQLLAERFVAAGGRLMENARWKGSCAGEGIVLANGRRLRSVEKGWRWFGLKVHARQVALEADLEMHGWGEGYVGLCRLPGGETNVCGLFRARPGSAGHGGFEMLRGGAGSSLHQRLAGAIFEKESFCSVAGLGLGAHHAVGQEECRIGDALTMIPPVTGNGMSMAFEAAEIALEPMHAYARGAMPWQAARLRVARGCDEAFRSRLLWARWLQALMFSPLMRGRAGQCVLKSNWLWDLLFTRTR